jgi:hypothetical protein
MDPSTPGSDTRENPGKANFALPYGSGLRAQQALEAEGQRPPGGFIDKGRERSPKPVPWKHSGSRDHQAPDQSQTSRKPAVATG